MQSINKKSLLWLIVAAFSLSNCNNQNPSQKELQSEVMGVHDSLMLKMEATMSNNSALSLIKSKLDSLKTINPGLDTTKISTEIKTVSAQLTAADDAMMKWMNNFNPDYTGKSKSEIIDYLKNQKLKIDSVKTLYQQSLSKSDSLLSKYKSL